MTIIKDFPECPDCGSTETVSNEATKEAREKGKLPADAFSHLEVTLIPLEQPMMAGVTVPTILVHWDVCLGCGRRRCTRAEIIQAPVVAQPGAHGTQGPRNFNMGFPKGRG